MKDAKCKCHSLGSKISNYFCVFVFLSIDGCLFHWLSLTFFPGVRPNRKSHHISYVFEYMMLNIHTKHCWVLLGVNLIWKLSGLLFFLPVISITARTFKVI